MNKFVKYLLCFFVGFLIARMIGNGFSVGGIESSEDSHNLCPNNFLDIKRMKYNCEDLNTLVKKDFNKAYTI